MVGMGDYALHHVRKRLWSPRSPTDSFSHDRAGSCRLVSVYSCIFDHKLQLVPSACLPMHTNHRTPMYFVGVFVFCQPMVAPLLQPVFFFARMLAGPDEGEVAQTEEQMSALRENLARKGKNSYYYAHGR